MSKKGSVKIPMLGIGLLALALGACNKDDKATAYGLTSAGTIIEFQTSDATSIENTATITGQPIDVSLVQLVYDPTSQLVYAIGSDNNLYSVTPLSGVVAAISTTPFTSDTLANVSASFDPVSKTIRITGTTSQGRDNLRIDPATSGTVVAQDDDNNSLTYDSGDSHSGQTSQIGGLAYSNPVSNAGDTTLYGLDVATQSLVRIGNENASDPTVADAGDIHTIGTPDVTFNSSIGFSITSGGTAYAALSSGSSSSLYTIDLDSGATTLVGLIGASGQAPVTSMVTVPNS